MFPLRPCLYSYLKHCGLYVPSLQVGMCPASVISVVIHGTRCFLCPRGVLQPWLHLISCMTHWSATLPWGHYTSAGQKICNLEANVIYIHRSTGTPSVFSYERNFLEQSSTSEYEINVSFALMFMLSIPCGKLGGSRRRGSRDKSYLIYPSS